MDVQSSAGSTLKILSMSLHHLLVLSQTVTSPTDLEFGLTHIYIQAVPVSAYYDSLVAKLIAWGRDFEEARIRTGNALQEFTIEGINTTIPLYKTIMDEQNFIKGELSTDYIERFKLMDKMNEDAKEQSRENVILSYWAILLQSEFVKKGRVMVVNSASTNYKSQNGKRRVGELIMEFKVGDLGTAVVDGEIIRTLGGESILIKINGIEHNVRVLKSGTDEIRVYARPFISSCQNP